MLNAIDCEIITPEKPVYHGTVEFVVVYAYNGEMGFLYNHAPLVAQLGIGEVRLHEGGTIVYLALQGGVVEISNNKLTILAEKAYTADELQETVIREQLEEINQKLRKDIGEERANAQLEQTRLKALLKVAMH